VLLRGGRARAHPVRSVFPREVDTVLLALAEALHADVFVPLRRAERPS